MCPSSSSSSVRGRRLSSSVYLLHCSVCKTDCFDKQIWEHHLTQEVHQNLTRLQDYIDPKDNLRECSLVIFTSYDLTVENAQKIIKYFSTDKHVVVTDFVWWEDRPRISIVQLESRKIVEAFLKNLVSNHKPIRICNQEIQVKGAIDLLDLEWKAILPVKCPFPANHSTEIPQSSSDVDRNYMESTEVVDEVTDSNKVVNKQKSNYLFLQLEDVSNAVRISSKRAKILHDIIRIFKKRLQQKLKSAKIVKFRNWYLNLKNQTSKIDPLLLFVHSSNSESSVNFVIDKLIESPVTSGKNPIKLFSRVFSKETGNGWKFIHNPSGFHFFVVNSKQAVVEAQLSELCLYYFEFDTRIRPLFYIAQYWKIINGLQFGQMGEPNKIFRDFLPEPYCLYWILITFLIHENLLPSVRTILGRPHTPIIEEETGTDIGFDMDLQFAREWKAEHKIKVNTPDKFVVTVLQLFHNFLQFCSTKFFNKDGSVVINPKDGEILKRDQVLCGNFTTKRSSQEVSFLCANLQEDPNHCWYMINPLIVKWQFSVPEKDTQHFTNSVVKKTCIKFKKLVNLIELYEPENALQLCGESLCEILKVDGDDRSLKRKRDVEELVEEVESFGSRKQIKNEVERGNFFVHLEGT